MDKSRIKIILIGLIVIFGLSMIGYKVYEKMNGGKGLINNFNIEYEGANNINIANNPSLMAMGKAFAGKAFEVEEWKNGYLKENSIDNYVNLENFENEIDVKYIQINEKLNMGIENNLVGKIKTTFEKRQNIWENTLGIAKEYVNNTKITFNEKARLYGILAREETYFNVYNYLYNNGINPQFNEIFAKNRFLDIKDSLINGGEEVKIVEKEKKFNTVQVEGNKIIQNAENNNKSIINAYKEINTLWNNYLNEELDHIKENKNEKVKNALNSFKEEMINSVNEEYEEDPQNTLEKIKLNIRLTQQEILNLIQIQMLNK